MKLHVLGSSSSGNGYVLEGENTALVLEAGVKFSAVKKALNFNISKIVGCIVTHEHGDHSKYAKEYVDSGIDMFLSEGTKNALKFKHHRLHSLKPIHDVLIGDFNVKPFDVKHDCAEPFGFLIQHDKMGLAVFATDTYYLPYKFPGLNHILVEVNYDEQILEANLDKGLPKVVKDRVLESHMSLDTFKDFIRANDIKEVNNIVLLHLSDGNSNAMRFEKEIKELSGKQTYVADKGQIINLSKNPF